jgi:outer membrane protein OmpA-like peptidoglycan-associated protein
VGLTIVTAIATPDGDYESIKQITSVTNDAVSLRLSADVPDWVILPKDYYTAKRTRVTKHVVSKRTVRREDLRSSHKYAQIFDEKTPEIVPGSTAITTSAATLQELKQTGQTTITYEVPDLVGQSDSFSFLKRAEPRPVPLPVLLNNRRVELPALHATGDIQGQEFYFLDDPENPIVLAWNLGDTVGRLQVIKIALPSDSLSALTGGGRDGNPLSAGGGAGGAGGSASPGGGPTSGGGGGAGVTGGGSGTAPGRAGEFPEIKQSLEQTGRVEIYGIYFEFDEAKIHEESEPVLKAIAYVLTQNPDWKVSIEGHTDNIGTDVYNLDLSKRRAAAVKQALVERYHLAANRLTTTGFGASRPKESNATLAGRARNRRVEIVRQ